MQLFYIVQMIILKDSFCSAAQKRDKLVLNRFIFLFTIIGWNVGQSRFKKLVTITDIEYN